MEQCTSRLTTRLTATSWGDCIAAPGSILHVPKIFSDKKLSMLLRLINGAGLRKVEEC